MATESIHGTCKTSESHAANILAPGRKGRKNERERETRWIACVQREGRRASGGRRLVASPVASSHRQIGSTLTEAASIDGGAGIIEQQTRNQRGNFAI